MNTLGGPAGGDTNRECGTWRQEVQYCQTGSSILSSRKCNTVKQEVDQGQTIHVHKLTVHRISMHPVAMVAGVYSMLLNLVDASAVPSHPGLHHQAMVNMQHTLSFVV